MNRRSLITLLTTGVVGGLALIGADAYFLVKTERNLMSNPYFAAARENANSSDMARTMLKSSKNQVNSSVHSFIQPHNLVTALSSLDSAWNHIQDANVDVYARGAFEELQDQYTVVRTAITDMQDLIVENTAQDRYGRDVFPIVGTSLFNETVDTIDQMVGTLGPIYSEASQDENALGGKNLPYQRVGALALLALALAEVGIVAKLYGTIFPEDNNEALSPA